MTTLVCVPGFLGKPDDFDFLRAGGIDVEPITLREAAALKIAGVDRSDDVLLGYSMGGRLALEALASGVRFAKAVIVSAGLNLEAGRDARRLRDEAWAARFERDAWDLVMRDWNAQPVFGGHQIERRESDSERAEAAHALRTWSPGVMEPLAPRLASIDVPLLWIAGERDAQYVEVARRAMIFLPNARLWICGGAGHRVPWEQPEAFAQQVVRFVQS